MAKKRDIITDENSDWIKLVNNGRAQRQELRIHAKLEKEYKKSNKNKRNGR